MKVINKENIVLFDTDNTIIKWSSSHHKPGKNKILFIDPYTGEKVYLKEHKVHVRLLKQYKARGNFIIVASKAGYKWSELVVKKLGLTEYVDLIMTKPDRWVDDSEKIEDVIGNRVFLKDRDE